MAEKTYRVIVSDRAKQMLGTHIRFLAQVSKEAAIGKKKALIAAGQLEKVGEGREREA